MSAWYKVIYKKLFEFKDEAIAFIESHKKQDCFTLSYCYSNNKWIVEKTQVIK